MAKSFLLLTLLLCSRASFAQMEACNQHATGYLHANEVRASVTNVGALFFNGNEGVYQIPYDPAGSTFSPIYLNGLWLGAKDPAGNIREATAQYGLAADKQDFWPGPLDDMGTTGRPTCENWNRIWDVRRYEINAHLEAFFLNGSVPNPTPNILTWPGKGNPYFKNVLGFDLPTADQGLAPFFDQNNDGIYDPKAGDYPRPAGVQTIPGQVLWAVFNDQGGGALHAESNGLSLGVEVQFTAWSFDCTDLPLLNRTIFASYKVVNRSGSALDSLYLGLFQDSDLGCYLDDAAGCSPALNAVFQYNIDDEDGPTPDCPIAYPDYAAGPPVSSVVFLNQPLSHIMVLDPVCLGNTATDDYYGALQGKNSFGPTTFGGHGCDPNNPATPLAFPGDPNNPAEWSMASANVSGFDVKTVASTLLGNLAPGQAKTLDFAFGYHRVPGGTNLSNLTAMYDEVQQVQAIYDLNFANLCTQPTECELDCVWAGDANHDGTANYCDLLPIGLSNGLTGPARGAGSLYWAPLSASGWADELPGNLNRKHADCDGNGEIVPADFRLTIDHYGFTNPDFVPSPDVYNPGPELWLKPAPNLDTLNMQPNQAFLLAIRVEEVPGLYGLAFQVDFDQRYFTQSALFNGFTVTDESMKFNRKDERPSIHGLSDYAYVLRQPGATVPEGSFNFLSLQASAFEHPLQSNQTKIRIKNIKAVREDGTLIDLGSTDLNFTFPSIQVSGTESPTTEEPSAYPNPLAGDQLTVSFPGHPMQSASIIDLLGRVQRSAPLANLDTAQLGLQGLAPGVYVLLVNAGTKSYRQVILKN